MKLKVAAAVMCNDRQQILIQQRPPGKHRAGYWEFPGGKLEGDESSWQALERELQEELNIVPTSGSELITLEHDYSDRHVTLNFWLVDAWQGQIEAQEQQQFAWHSLDMLASAKLLPADAPVLDALAKLFEES